MSEDISNRIQNLERRVSTIETWMKGEPDRPAIPKPTSIREFVNLKNPSTSAETALLIAYYLEKFSAVSPFNHDDLIGGFAQAKEPLPKNPSDTVYKNIRRGFLTESPQKKGGSKAWIVTNSGERFVENDLKEP